VRATLHALSYLLIVPRLVVASPLIPYTSLFRSVASGKTASATKAPRKTAGQKSATATAVAKKASKARTLTKQATVARTTRKSARSEEHTSELQSREYLVCRLLLEKKNSKLLRDR